MKRTLYVLFLVSLAGILSCTKQQVLEVNEAELFISDTKVIPVEDAIDVLQEFLQQIKMTKSVSGIERQIKSVETLYSQEAKDAAGEKMPEAYLVNFEDEGGFAILGANTDIDRIIAVVEGGNKTWADIFDVKENRRSSFEEGCPDPGIKPAQLLSMCVRGALYVKRDEQTIFTKSEWETEILPLTSNQQFSQQVTYCHKNNRGFVTNGCASTALAIVMACNEYPDFVVDYESIDYSACNSYDGVGYKYTFSNNEIYIQLSDYFTNSASIPSVLSTGQKLNILTQADPGVINTHGTPSVSDYADNGFYRTRYKLTSAVFYKLSNIIQSWDATGTMPAAVETGLEDLGYINVNRERRSSLTNNQIATIRTMLEDGKPVIMCGWSLFNLSNSHYWVVDGLRSAGNITHIHCNWGWGPGPNGWYSTNCLRPAYQAPTTQTGNDWGNIIVYEYGMGSFPPVKGEFHFADNMPVQYE